MEGMFYNVKFGYLEGIVRGYRNTLLTGAAYNSTSIPLHSHHHSP